MAKRVIAEISVVPIGTPGPSVSNYVAACYDILRDIPEIRFQLTPMCTILEGSMERVLEAMQQMHEVPFSRGIQRVLTTLKIDDRRDKPLTLEGKVEAVLKKEASRGKK